jgi:hypothetical protein
MVQHAAFLKNIAIAFGESESTIKLVHRILREAGCLRGQRGKHSPERVPADAAIFVCWIGVTDKPALAESAINDFGHARATGRTDDWQKEFLARLQLSGDHSLLDMVEALIKASAAGIRLSDHNYRIDFQPDELFVRLDFGFNGFGYSREDDPETAKRHTKPYRVVRTIPHQLIESVATMFKAPDRSERPR